MYSDSVLCHTNFPSYDTYFFVLFFFKKLDSDTPETIQPWTSIFQAISIISHQYSLSPVLIWGEASTLILIIHQWTLISNIKQGVGKFRLMIYISTRTWWMEKFSIKRKFIVVINFRQTCGSLLSWHIKAVANQTFKQVVSTWIVTHVLSSCCHLHVI